MSKILCVLGFSANDAIQCERLLDLIAALNEKIPKGDLLLVASPDTHSENRIKCKISAEIAFKNVELLEVGWPAVAHTTKYESVNYLWLQGMTHATRCYQSPALWLEPDAIPLKPTWLDELTHEYYAQPKRYMGAILTSADGKQKCLSRVAAYPRGAGGDLKDFCAVKTPFEIAAGNIVVPRAGKSKLFQQLTYTATTERSAIRKDAVLLHGDKAGVLLAALLEEASRPTHVLLSDSGIRQDIFVPLPPEKQKTPILHLRGHDNLRASEQNTSEAGAQVGAQSGEDSRPANRPKEGHAENVPQRETTDNGETAAQPLYSNPPSDQALQSAQRNLMASPQLDGRTKAGRAAKAALTNA